MKLKPYQLALWCDAVVFGRRKWLWLAGNILILLLAALLHLFWPALDLLLLANAVLLIYLLHQHHAFGKIYHRKPRPVDANCETVQLDASLIGHGVRLRAAAQPIDVGDGLSMRLGTGALLLGTAMVLTADEVPGADRAAILSAVNALKLRASSLLIHNPVLRRDRRQDVTIVTVRDGMSERHYYIGAPSAVAQCCGSIWEGSTRELTAHDHTRIADTAHYITQGNCRVIAWATALEQEKPIFLGMCGLGEEIHPVALRDADKLRTMGLTLMLKGKNHTDAELQSLHELLELPVHHAQADIHLFHGTENDIHRPPTLPLIIFRQPEDSLVDPIAQIRRRFHIIEATLRRFGQMLLLPMLLSVILMPSLLVIGVALLLLGAAIYLGVDLTIPRLRWPTVVIISILALLARLLTGTQPAASSLMAGGVMTIVAAYCAMIRLCGDSFRFSLRIRNPAFWLTIGSLLMIALLLWHTISSGAPLLLPLGFAVIISALIALLMLYERKFFR